jgi:hypothetical protein
MEGSRQQPKARSFRKAAQEGSKEGKKGRKVINEKGLCPLNLEETAECRVAFNMIYNQIV